MQKLTAYIAFSLHKKFFPSVSWPTKFLLVIFLQCSVFCLNNMLNNFTYTKKKEKKITLRRKIENGTSKSCRLISAKVAL